MYTYLTCFEGAVAVSFEIRSSAGLHSDWTLYRCWVLSLILVRPGDEEQVSEAFCSGVDSVLTGVEVTCLCFSDDCLTVSESFDEHGGGMAWSDAGGCEAHFCTTVSVAGD